MGLCKSIISGCDQSLQRMWGFGDYADIFYHYRPDLIPFFGRTAEALMQLVRAYENTLYIGISNYNEKTPK